MKMMKKIIFFIGIAIMVMGCESVLDIEPTNIISEEAVKSDPDLVDAYLTNVYNDTRFQSGSSYAPDQALLNVVSGEANVFAAWQAPFAAAKQIIDENGAHSQLEYWPYQNIRDANEILQILEAATFDEDIIIQRSAEARFLRAFMYFELVKRYGGVPLITEPQSIDASEEELYVSRNSEQEIYDFVASEMDDLIDLLPSEYTADDYGRPTKWAAYALKSRAMLYAGSIATYGAVQLDGLLGIPANEANAYYQKAYDAAMEIINNSPHTLYQENTDPADNYHEIFTVDANSEIIFAEVYDLGLLKTHSWNYVCMPDGFITGWGSNNWMYLESWERFEYNDGTPGTMDRDALDGNTWFALDEIILNRDPRLLATAFYPETPWQDATVYMHKSTVGTIPEDSDWPSSAPARNYKKTGMLIQKRVDESVKLPIAGEDEVDWTVFRLGEMYLNAAEAKYEIGETETATDLINVIRNRAGMPDKETLTLEDVRNERFVELYCEEHRYWDIRRWRIAVEELNGKGFKGVDWIYNIDENKYSLTMEDADYSQIRTFMDHNYYFPISLDRLADNPNLVENPGY
jgi:hypothetical protein